VRRPEQREPREERRDLGRRASRQSQHHWPAGQDGLADELATRSTADETKCRFDRRLALLTGEAEGPWPKQTDQRTAGQARTEGNRGRDVEHDQDPGRETPYGVLSNQCCGDTDELVPRRKAAPDDADEAGAQRDDHHEQRKPNRVAVEQLL